MKTKAIRFIILPALLVFSSYTYIEDVIAKLGLTHDNAQNHILANFTGGFGDFGNDTFFKLPYAKLLPSVVTGDKTGATKELLAYVKMYCNSEEFSKAYSKKRNNLKPTPESEPQRMDEATLESMRSTLKDLEASLLEMKKNPKQNAQAIPIYEEMLIAQRAQMAEWEDPTPNLTKWKSKFPEDPAVAVKNRLEAYLKLVATVDFDAKLTEPDKYKIRKFVNPAYESKSDAWKASYRAGKEVNDIAKAFVQDWLKGEIIASNKVTMPKEAQVKSSSGVKAVVNNKESDTTTSPDADAPSEPVKQKKSLLSKLKDKAKDVLD